MKSRSQYARTRSYVTDYRLECRVLCQGGCQRRLHLPHESPPGNTEFIYRFESVNYPLQICPLFVSCVLLSVRSDPCDFLSVNERFDRHLVRWTWRVNFMGFEAVKIAAHVSFCRPFCLYYICSCKLWCKTEHSWCFGAWFLKLFHLATLFTRANIFTTLDIEVLIVGKRGIRIKTFADNES